jgi:hypothetical protein
MITTTDNDIKERLSIGYVAAVAARAGCQVVEWHVDRNKIDVTIGSVSGTPAKLDVQLKCTENANFTPTHLVFSDLDVASYDVLRSTVIQSPKLLVVLSVPTNSDHWVTAGPDELILRTCAYWINLCGEPEVQNTSTKTVYLPRAQAFHPDALRDLMSRAHKRAEQGQTGL